MTVDIVVRAARFTNRKASSILDTPHNTDAASVMYNTNVLSTLLPTNVVISTMFPAFVHACIQTESLGQGGVSELLSAHGLTVVGSSMLQAVLDAIFAVESLVALRVGTVVFAVLPFMLLAFLLAIIGIGAGFEVGGVLVISQFEAHDALIQIVKIVAKGHDCIVD